MRPRAVRAARAISRHCPRAEILDTTAPTRQTDAAEGESEDAACPYTAAKSMMSSLRSPPARPANGEDFPVYPGPGADVLRNIADVMYIGMKGMERATLYFADSYGPVARCAPVTECRLGGRAVVVGRREPLCPFRGNRSLHCHRIDRRRSLAVTRYVWRPHDRDIYPRRLRWLRSGRGASGRFPNPISLGDAAGWVFLNNPELIEHCCRTNTANYTERFLPV